MNPQTPEEFIKQVAENVPQELQTRAQWVVWRLEPNPSKPEKPKKPPYIPNPGAPPRKASDTNPSTWGTFTDACSTYLAGDYTGVGFIFTESDSYTGLDLDDCIEDGEPNGFATPIIHQMNTYTEISPSETGLHMIARGVLPEGGRRNDALGVEMYDSARYFTFTGNRIPGTPAEIYNRQSELNRLHEKIFPPKTVTAPPTESPQGGGNDAGAVAITLDDAQLLERARQKPGFAALWDGDTSGHQENHSSADLALCNHLAFWTNGDAARMDALFRKSGLMRQKWDAVHHSTGGTYGAGTIAIALKGFTKGYTGTRQNGTHQSNGTGNLVHNADDGQTQDGKIPPPVDVFKYRAEDGGILDCWIELHAPGWMYATGYDYWFRWQKSHWVKDEEQALQHGIQVLMDGMNQTARAAIKRAKEKRNEDAAKIAQVYVNATKRTAGRVASVEKLAEPHRAISAARLDGGNSLNLLNGVLELDTLNFREHNPEDFFTYCLPFAHDADAQCPRFEQFVNEVLVKDGTTTTDEELVQLWQELWGYTLTTATHHEIMVWLAGDGGNGKTVALTVLGALLGPMAKRLNFHTLGQPGNYDMADLPGKRLVLSTESQRNGHVTEEIIRQLVSGETQTARAIYGSPFEFTPMAKIWWAMNDKPTLMDTSNAIWRRMKLIPFNRTFSNDEKDVHLTGKLMQELPGILNWALAGLHRLNERGRFSNAGAVADAVAEYRKESNPVFQWLEEQTIQLFEPATQQSILYKNYRGWCVKSGNQALTSKAFSTELKRLSVGFKRANTGMVYALGLKSDETEPETGNFG